MNIPDIDDHLMCYNYEHTQKATIQTLSLAIDDKINFTSIYNKIISLRENGEELILFLPSGKTFQYCASETCNIFILRIQTPITLCMGYSPEMLFKNGFPNYEIPDCYKKNKLGRMRVLPPVSHLLEGINIGISNGMKCRCWFELKINELFMLLRVYYPKSELYKFLYPAINGDNEFSKLIIENWKKYPTVEQLSAFMNMTTRQLSTRFIAVFGCTPGKWLIRERAQIIHNEIISTSKPFNQIASENGFAAESVFTHFCTREFGTTPSQLRRNKKNNLREK